MDCSPPGSCVHGILQARILEWQGSPGMDPSLPGPRPWLYPAEHSGQEKIKIKKNKRTLMNLKKKKKNTGVGCHFLLQGIFPTQGSNSYLVSPALAGGFFTSSAIWGGCATPIYKGRNPQRQRGGMLWSWRKVDSRGCFSILEVGVQEMVHVSAVMTRRRQELRPTGSD